VRVKTCRGLWQASCRIEVSRQPNRTTSKEESMKTHVALGGLMLWAVVTAVFVLSTGRW
jgi:hypothetical protein